MKNVVAPSGSFRSGVLWASAANLGYMGLMAIVVIVLPRFVNQEQYGLWQLYIFYAIYLGYLSFGIHEGLYLRYGGWKSTKLDSSVITAHLLTMVIADLVVVTIFIAAIGHNGDNQALVALLAGIAVLFYLPRAFFSSLLQATGRLRDYGIAMLLERVVMLLLTVGALVAGVRDFQILILCDVGGKIVGLGFCLWMVRAWLAKPRLLDRHVWGDIWVSVVAGLPLMITNLAALLINAVVRYGINWRWGVAVFGMVSLGFSVANLFQGLITAISAALFPSLKRLDRSVYGEVFLRLRTALELPLLLALPIIWPISVVLQWWLPGYDQAAYYLLLMAPVVIFECRARITGSVFLNALRAERSLMMVNLLSVALAVVATVMFTYLWPNLSAALVSISVVIALRALGLEFLVMRYLALKGMGNWFWWVGVVTLFLLAQINQSVFARIGFFALTVFLLWYQGRDCLKIWRDFVGKKSRLV